MSPSGNLETRDNLIPRHQAALVTTSLGHLVLFKTGSMMGQVLEPAMKTWFLIHLWSWENSYPWCFLKLGLG